MVIGENENILDNWVNTYLGVYSFYFLFSWRFYLSFICMKEKSNCYVCECNKVIWLSESELKIADEMERRSQYGKAGRPWKSYGCLKQRAINAGWYGYDKKDLFNKFHKVLDILEDRIR